MVSVDGQRPRIVVGVDGSEPSKAALRWAVRQARLVGGVVEAVTAWEYPAFYGLAGPVGEDFDYAANAQEMLAETLAGLGPHRPSDIRTRVAEGNAAHVLLDAAEGADLLVVGNRGHGGFAEALLGSVGQHCTHHAACPVVVIRAGLA